MQQFIFHITVYSLTATVHSPTTNDQSSHYSAWNKTHPILTNTTHQQLQIF